MRAVLGGVVYVVDQVGRARGNTERGEDEERFDPPLRVVELGRENDACEDEEVLRPLQRARCADERMKVTAP